MACFWLLWEAGEPLASESDILRIDSMSSSHDRNPAPAVLLLNEIEKLLARTQSMEGEIRQAHAEAEKKIAELQATSEEFESLCRAKDEEIAELQNQVAAKERLLTGRHEALSAVEIALHDKIQSLQQELAERRRDIAERDGAIEILNSETAALRQELPRLKNYAPAQPPAGSSRDRIAPQAAGLAAEQECAMKTDDQDAPLNRDALEQSLRDEVDRLVREGQERNQILQDRNDELVRVKAELDRLRERLDQLESSAAHGQSALREDSERMRTEFQAQLALLQAELSQREWALEERQGQEQNLRQEIETLRRRLSENQSLKPATGDAFVFGAPRDEASQGGADSGYSGSFAQKRRWHSGHGWKRRWRSS